MLAVPVQMVWPRLDPDDVDRGHPHGQSVAKNPAFLPFILEHEGNCAGAGWVPGFVPGFQPRIHTCSGLCDHRILSHGPLPLQIEMLSPFAAVAEQFKEQYKNLATVLDGTQHELPVRGVHLQGSGKELLGRKSCVTSP